MGINNWRKHLIEQTQLILDKFALTFYLICIIMHIFFKINISNFVRTMQ